MNQSAEYRADVDGLSDLQYFMVGKEMHSTYTKIIIDIRRIVVKKLTLYINGEPQMDIELEPGMFQLLIVRVSLGMSSFAIKD